MNAGTSGGTADNVRGSDASGGAVSRRAMLRAGGVGVGMALVGGLVSTDFVGGAASAGAATVSTAAVPIPFFGRNQAGILTPSQQHLSLAVLDLGRIAPNDLVALLKAWTSAANRMSKGQPVGDLATGPAVVPADSGETVDQGAAKLTITFGFGPSVFDRRFGLASARPGPLADLPAFDKDQFDPSRTGGDVMIQACADSPQVADHAIRNLARIGAGKSTIRWTQRGFLDVQGAPGASGGTPRNVIGFRDGTANLDTADRSLMERNVWASASESPAWMAGGTYAVIRRIRNLVEAWDNASLDEQEQSIGRRKYSGAAFGSSQEFGPVNSALLPIDSHVRLANPRTGRASDDERILRRGYNYADGLAQATGPVRDGDGQLVTGQIDSGLMFVAFQRDPRKQFVPMQTRLNASDKLNEYLIHNGSGVFAVVPGAVDERDWIGRTLMERSGR